jgi:hypothetical protein
MFSSSLVPALVAGLALACGAASAATLTEAGTTGGAFSSRWDSPTEVGAGITAISGTGSQNVFDNFVFTGLSSGAQKLTLNFAAPAGIDTSYSAGASVLYATEPFRWGWDGATAGTVQVDHYTPSRTLDLDLGDSFSGRLYLALNFTHGSDLAYSIGVPAASGVTPSPVPLPAGVLLIGSAAAVLGGLGLTRRRQPATA